MADSVTRRTSEGLPSSAPEAALPSDPDRTEIAAQNAIVGAAGAPPSESHRAVGLADDKTVISKQPPIAEAALPRTATPQEMGRILVGERLGHFQLEEFVGGGGMGAVFRATDTMLGRTVAVKVLSRDQTDDDTLLRFQKEAQNAARLDHERIARVYYVNEDKGWHYIVFEYIDGVNVRDLVDEQGPLSFDEAVYYTLQVAEALRHASRRDVVHRDIKPSNILVMADGRVKLVDMGLARSHQVESSQADLTQSGVTLGTFDYISPEQAREPRNADVRSDIYSLGCTLYFMLTGRPPFPEGTVLQKLLSHSSDAPPDPRLFRPDIPDDICRVLMKMLAKLPTQRFQTPDDLIADLLRVADRLGLERTTAGGSVWVARPEPNTPWYEKHLPWAAPVVTLVLVILALEWLTGAPVDRLAPPRPNLLPPSAASIDRRPGAPTIPIARRTEGDGLKKQSSSAVDPVEETPASGNSDSFDDSPEPLPPMSEPVEKTAPTETPMAVPSATDAIRLLVVGSASTPHTADSMVVPSFGEAVAAAPRYPRLEAIELHYDGERVEKPIAISAGDLSVRAAPGRAPVMVFRPTADALADERRMIRVAAGNLTFQGVQFRLELPTQRAGENWSLFSLGQVRSLLLDRCAVTVRNATLTGAVAQSGVAVVETNAPVVTDTQTPPEQHGRPLVRLFSSLVRGETSLVRSEGGQAFRLEWTQGLFASTERLADISGAAQLSSRWPRAEIDLENVTAAARNGLCVLRSKPDASKHLGLRVSATDCVFLTDPSAPLLEHRTFELFEDLKRRHPEFEGRGNIIAGTKQYWRLLSQRTSEPIEPTTNISLERGADYGFAEPVWSSAVAWKGLPTAARLPHTHFKSDYLLSDDPDNPALRQGEAVAGFDPTVLPEFFTEAALAPATSEDAPRTETAPAATSASGSGMSEKMKMIMAPSTARPTPVPLPSSEDADDM